MSDSYRLVWQDDFNCEDIDRSSWNIECHEASWINNELQEYTDNRKVVFAKDGCAVIRPEKSTNSDGSVNYYSGYMTTTGLKSFKYGKFEARIRVPRGRGLLPAFKLIPDKNEYGDWPRSGDIGVMEILGQEPSKIYGTIRFGEPLAQRQGCNHIYEGSYSDDFHVYSCEWTPSSISFYADGIKFYESGFWYSGNSDGSEVAPYPAPFNAPFAICLSISIGSQWAGSPDTRTEYGDAAQMLVDYVRVYQKDEYDEDVQRPIKALHLREPDDTGNYIQPSPNDWDFQLHRSGYAEVIRENSEFTINTVDVGDEIFSIQLVQPGIPLEKGQKYRLSFDACSSIPRTMVAAVTAPDVGWDMYLKYTTIHLDTMYQNHSVYFEMQKDSDDNARVEFNAGAQDSMAQIRIKNVRLEKIFPPEDKRKVVAVCGVWEDAENFSQFIEALQTPELTKNNIIAGITFGSAVMRSDDESVQNKMIQYVDELDLSAIIIFVEMLKSENIVRGLMEIAGRKKIPVFSFEHSVEGCINSSYDYRSGFRTIVNHIIEEHHCKDIIMFGGFEGNYFSDERIDVYRECLEEHGLEFSGENVFYGDFWNAKAEVVMQGIIDSGRKIPDAIICANDSMAVGVCDCLNRNNIRVPEDVAVTGFDGIREAKSHNPAISTCEPDYSSIVAMIHKDIENWDPAMTGVTQSRNTHYIPKLNRSCGCPPERDEEWYDVISELASDNQDYFRHVLEMGQFVTRAINTDNIDVAAEDLRHYLWMWPKYLYFIGLNIDDNCIHGIFSGEDGKYNYRHKYYSYETAIPDIDKIVDVNSKYNVLLMKQIRTADESYGLMVQAYSELSLRDEQRFEEFALYVSAVVSAVFNNRKLIEAKNKIELLSESDYLTGLYNRRGFLKRVQEIIDNPNNQHKVISMFSIDMDGLKMINDNYGHNEGDCAIRVLARALKAYTGSRGICARYGGDEFAICIVGDRELLPEFVSIHDRIRSHCASDHELDDKPYTVDASIGISERRIRPGVNLEDLISFSDTAMYIDKQSRKMK